jgi:WD40 repeat protein
MAETFNDEYPPEMLAPSGVKRKSPRWRRLLLIMAVILIVVLPASIVVGNRIKNRPSTLAVAFSPDGHLLASGSTDGTIKLWDVASDTLLHTLSGHTGVVTSVAFSPNGRILASGSASASGDLGVHLWDVASVKELRTLPFIEDAYTLTFSPDGRFLYVGTNAGVPIWDMQSGKELSGLEAGGSRAIALSPDGRMLASTPPFVIGLNQPSILLWDLASRKLLRTLYGHTHGINSVAFSPDGHLLASGSNDETIKLWSPVTGTPLRTLKGHTDAVNALAFSPDGHLLASGSSDLTLAFWADQTVKLWDVKSGSEVRTLSG